LSAFLPSPDYSEEERRLIVDYIAQLTKPTLARFMREHQLSGRAGTKENMRERIEEALAQHAVSFTDLVGLLDEVEPWGKQHVYFLRGPEGLDLGAWLAKTELQSYLTEKRVGKYLDRKLPLILPEKLSLSSIEHSSNRLRVTAIERRDGWERDETNDRSEQAGDERIQYRAYVKRVSRGLIAFEWDLIQNVATVQISQLPSGFRYEQALGRFNTLVKRWLPMDTFTSLGLARAIQRFHEWEAEGLAITRSHSIGYRTPGNRELVGKTLDPQGVFLGQEDIVDDAMNNAKTHGSVGSSGNFYFLPSSDAHNPLSLEVHAILWAGDLQRVNFPTSNVESEVRYVLRRIREASR